MIIFPIWTFHLCSFEPKLLARDDGHTGQAVEILLFGALKGTTENLAVMTDEGKTWMK